MLRNNSRPLLRNLLNRKRGRNPLTRRRTRSIEQLERRDLLVAAIWNNALFPVNVSGDESGVVSALDTLLVVNELNHPVHSDPETNSLPRQVTNTSDRPFLDVSCDGIVSPLDVLLVINHINDPPSDPGDNTRSGSGTYADVACSPQLVEGPNYSTELSRVLTLPDATSAIEVLFEVPDFDVTSRDSIRDAFEIEVTDSDGNPVTLPYILGRDVFYNWTEELEPVFSPSTTTTTNPAGQDSTARVNLSGLGAGTQVRVTTRLVNNDADESSSVIIRGFEIVDAPSAAPSGMLPPRELAAAANGIDFASVTDVSSSVAAVFGRTTLVGDHQTQEAEPSTYERISINDGGNHLLSDVSLANVGTFAIGSQIFAVIENISDPRVKPLDIDGFTATGLPYFDFSPLVDGSRLNPGSQSNSRTLAFSNPANVPFELDLQVLAEVNRSPRFVSQPLVEALVGKPYEYRALADDPDSDVLSFSLGLAPEGMRMDPQAGGIQWTATESQIGHHSVEIQVSDGRGGLDRQTFTVQVHASIPNRPPRFDTSPVGTALVNSVYQYASHAVDPDLDPVVYALLESPPGMTIDPAMGLIQWTPSAADVAATGTAPHRITLAATDNLGGTAEQTYDIHVFPEQGNRPPIIFSDPVTAIAIAEDQVVSGLYRYDADALDPDSDALVYRLLDAPPGMTIDGDSGLIQWAPPSEFVTAGRVQFADGEFLEEDWTFTTYSTGQSESSSDFLTQLENGNPGQYREIRITQTRPPAGEVLTTFSVHLNDHAVYDPATQGSINTIDYSEDAKRLDGSHSVGLALVQNGVAYRSIGQSAGNPNEWLDRIFTRLTAEDFSPFPQEFADPDSVPANPDFSKNGAPIQFGFWRSYAHTPDLSGTQVTRSGIDNWSVTVDPVPEAAVSLQVEDGRGGVDTQDYVLQFLPPSTIRGFKFHDASGDGRFQRAAELILSSNGIYRYDQLSHALIATVAELSGGRGASLAPDGRLLIRSGGLTLVDLETGDRETVIDASLLTNPSAVAYGPDGNIYVGSVTERSIQRFDGQTYEFIDNFASSPNISWAIDLEFGPDGDLYVVSIQSDLIFRFDGTTGLQKASYLSGGSLADMAFGPDGNFYVTAVDADRVFRFEPDGSRFGAGSLLSSSNGLDGPDAIAFGPDGKVYVHSIIDLDVAVFDFETLVLENRIENNRAGILSTLLFTAPQTEPVESPLDNWTIFLDLNRNGQHDPDEPTTTSDENGEFNFVNLAAGSYRVGEIQQEGWRHTAPLTRFHEITVRPDETRDEVNFGNRLLEGPAVNQPPSFFTMPSTTANVGGLYRYDARATDLDWDPVLYSLPLAPKGMVIHSGTGRIGWTPQPDQIGEHSILVRAQDVHGNFDLQQFTIIVSHSNTPPIVVSRPDTLAMVGTSYEYAVAAQDAEDDQLSFRLTDFPDGMSISEAGVISWNPDVAELGPHLVSVVVSDGHAEATQSYTLAVVDDESNSPPEILSIPRTRIVLGGTYFYHVLARDPNRDPLTIAFDSAPAGMTIEGNSVIRWQPTPEQLGQNSVTVRVEDGRGQVVRQSFDIEVTTLKRNRAPEVTSLPRLSATANESYEYDVEVLDPDGDPLVFSLSERPSGMSIHPVLGTIRWTPSLDQLGTHLVSVTVIDAQGAEATQTFSLTVNALNGPPVILTTPITIAALDRPYAYQVQALDSDGDVLGFRLVSAPQGMVVNADSGQISWTPASDQLGQTTVAAEVFDGRGGVATQVFDVEVLAAAPNSPPEFVSLPPRIFSQGATGNLLYRYDALAIDADDESITYLLPEGPDDSQVTLQDGVVTWLVQQDTPLGDHSFVLEARDTSGGIGQQRFTVRLEPPNSLPTVDGPPLRIVEPDRDYRYDILASDADGDPLSYTLTIGPAGLSVDERRGSVSWMPQSSDVGEHPVEVTISDGRGGDIVLAYSITVAIDDQPPVVFVSAKPDPALVGDEVVLQVFAGDNVGLDTLSLQVAGAVLPLDASGRASFTTTQVGPVAFEAVALDLAGNETRSAGSISVIDPDDTTAPVVEIISPDQEARITALTDVVGTVTDDNLLFYTIEVVPVTGGRFVELARGTATATNAVLGTFDPSLLANDTYVLRLRAVDAGGNEATDSRLLHVAGNLKLGGFQLTFLDLEVPVAGIPIQAFRTYDTLQANRSGDFGFGWRLDLTNTDLRTSVRPTGFEDSLIYNPYYDGARVYITLPGEQRQGFTFRPRLQGGLRGSFLGLYEPVFEPDAGVTSQLTVKKVDILVDGAGDTSAFQSLLAYNPTSPAFGGKFTLTTQEGLIFEIDGQTGDVEFVTDPGGNLVEFRSDAIVSSKGPRIDIERDARNRITALIDPMGQRIEYTYDAAGDLVSTTDREGNVTSYGYSASRSHYLTDVVNPLGNNGARTEYDEQGRLVRTLDAAGNPLVMAYDLDHSTQTVTDALGNVSLFEYDQRGNVVREMDPLGGETLRTYDDQNNMLSETNPLGNTTSYTYDANRNPTTETDPLGNSTTFTHQRFTYGTSARARVTGRASLPFSRLTSSIDPAGNVTTIDFNFITGNETRLTDPSGAATNIEYGPGGVVTATVDANGNRVEIESNSVGLPERVTDAAGNVVTYTYDALGRRTGETRQQSTPTGVVDVVNQMQYDGEGRLVASIDPAGEVTRYEYDALGQQTAIVDALGRRTETDYDSRGNVIERRFANGARIQFEYDALNRVVKQTDAQDRATWFEYDPLGRLTATIFPDATPEDLSDNPRTSSEYDAAGQLLAEIDELGNRTEFEYDSAGRRTVFRDALGNEVHTMYNRAGRPTQIVDPRGNITQLIYDERGFLTTTVFADDSQLTNEFDGVGRLIATTNQEGDFTQYEHDVMNNLSAVTDSAGGRTEFAYDELGNLIAQTDALGRTTSFTFDSLSRQVATTRPMGQTSTREYDAVGNLVSQVTFGGDVIDFEYDALNRPIKRLLPNGQSYEFSYTASGQLETATDSRGLTEYSYDERNRLTRRVEPDGTELSFQYDAVGNRLAQTTPSGTTSYEYDALNRLVAVTDPAGQVTRYAYDANSNPITTELPNGVVESRTFDALNRLITLEVRNPTMLLAQFSYVYDRIGNRLQVDELGGRSVQYSYDSRMQLTTEMIAEADGSTRSITYTYDAVGNRLSRDDSALGLTSYEYNDNDQLLIETLAGDETRYTYDDSGNQLSRVTATDAAFYEWDAENRLIAVDADGDGTSDVEYQYSAFGVRVGQTTDAGETRYLVDTGRSVPQILEEYTPSGLVQASFVYGGKRISQNRNGAVAYYHADANHSVRLLTDSAGMLTNTYLYDAYGRLLDQTGVVENPFLFTGEQLDPTTGLYNLRARQMDVASGRFLSTDPFEGFSNSPVTLHRYMYAGNNPVNFRDPSGELLIFELAGAAIRGVLRGLNTARRGATFCNLIQGTDRFALALALAQLAITLKTAPSPPSDLQGTYSYGFTIQVPRLKSKAIGTFATSTFHLKSISLGMAGSKYQTKFNFELGGSINTNIDIKTGAFSFKGAANGISADVAFNPTTGFSVGASADGLSLSTETAKYTQKLLAIEACGIANLFALDATASTKLTASRPNLKLVFSISTLERGKLSYTAYP